MVFNHVGYTSHLDGKKNLVTDCGSQGFKSPFLMGLSTGEQKTTFLTLEKSEGITLALANFFSETQKSLPAYAIIGRVHFDPISCSYLVTPPIHGENINLHSEKYWAKTEERPHCHAFIFGVVIREAGRKLFSPQILSKAFYKNPLDKSQSDFLSHTHAILMNNHYSKTSEKKNQWDANPADVLGVRHIFNTSVIKQGQFAIFEIESLLIEQ